MCNRTYRLLFGIALLLSLYFDSRTGLYGLIALALFEAISNLRVPLVIRRLRHQEDCDPDEGALGIPFTVRTNFEAERGWRLLVATFLTLSSVAFPETLWFVPWFMGFAIMGAGVSGVCPVFLALKWAGLR